MMDRPPRRVARLVGYCLFALAGVSAIVWPAPSVARATGWLVYLWAAWLAVGGLLSAAGAATDRWIGEYTGLPLLFAAFGVYGLVVVAGARSWASSAAALVLVAIGLVLAARWQDIGWVRREAARNGRRQSRA